MHVRYVSADKRRPVFAPGVEKVGPQPGPQHALLTCPIEEVFFGGARGGGKTAGALLDWLAHQQRFGAAAQGIFFRRRFRSLSEVQAQAMRLFPIVGATYRQKDATWTFPNGARLRFDHLWDSAAADTYQGQAFTWICIEEAGQWPDPQPINMLRATLRSTAGGIRLRFLLTGNPGGAGHQWLKRRFITPAPKGYVPIRDAETGALRVFIPSRVEDNRLLMENDPGYVARLSQTGSAALVRAWLKGDWDVVAGGAFDDVWDQERQVLPAFDVPSGWTFFRSFDWGSAKPASLGLWAVSDGTQPIGLQRHIPRGSLVRIGEDYTVASDFKGDYIPNVGTREDNAALGERIAKASRGRAWDGCVADPSIFTAAGGPSIYEQMCRGARNAGHTLIFNHADNNRRAGWSRMREMMLASMQERPEAPGLFVTEACEHWLRTVPVLQVDEKKPDDIDTDAEDHAGDDTRYAVMATRRTVAVGTVAIPNIQR